MWTAATTPWEPPGSNCRPAVLETGLLGRGSTVTVMLAIKKLDPELGSTIPMPERKSGEAAGFDLAAAEDALLEPGQFKLVGCGFAMALPAGYEAQVRPRSGLAFKHGITVLNSPGTIDSDYRGEVKVLLINHSRESFTIERGMRIAQLVVAEVAPTKVEVVTELDDSARGGGGFGSTGI